MKKLFIFILLLMLLFQFRTHPLVEPHLSTVKQLVLNKAEFTMGIDNFNHLQTDLRKLNSKISSYEVDYIVQHITNYESANQFWDARCSDHTLSHSVLTGYAIENICQVLEKHLQ
ncbi:hypothetical protein [Psychrobium sp. 1_MG-2023]|uniref:hypothetical protein n=1 Tax=Psychrobium sp. 1_MG-2023 TaxID=3062624 RepID=UPI000C3376D4|nr:hypothetical protein [Psychrobium sp. 1_MG-2023]MDP2560525.1 hypothetical protein [Psychrobium sp. 1_MG-2023]PKF53953.1 hypothetical protein CW748_17425 [Alteromonadales bacterium alter-6D02]